MQTSGVQQWFGEFVRQSLLKNVFIFGEDFYNKLQKQRSSTRLSAKTWIMKSLSICSRTRKRERREDHFERTNLASPKLDRQVTIHGRETSIVFHYGKHRSVLF
eukprot:TRINITY_DN232_c0_g1_i12.p2 TRINITY_DN232_c0_g1~~TRINITY_DN232_c0_g1_i12.p2  ORF type:complete len:104 (-),score=13.56 TRINITY_DN232_c0_g1_i12:8-319(-)